MVLAVPLRADDFDFNPSLGQADFQKFSRLIAQGIFASPLLDGGVQFMAVAFTRRFPPRTQEVPAAAAKSVAGNDASTSRRETRPSAIAIPARGESLTVLVSGTR